MSSKTHQKANGHSNGTAKRDGKPPTRVTQRGASKATDLTERAWKKTYENRHKTKTAA